LAKALPMTNNDAYQPKNTKNTGIFMVKV